MMVQVRERFIFTTLDIGGNNVSTFLYSSVIKTVLIEANENRSTAVDAESFRAVGLIMPPDWTTAALSFEVSVDGVNGWVPLYDIAGNLIKVDVPVKNTAHTFPYDIRPWRFFRLVSGTPGNEVNQSNTRKFKVALKF